jgi:hypothetical protein
LLPPAEPELTFSWFFITIFSLFHSLSFSVTRKKVSKLLSSTT